MENEKNNECTHDCSSCGADCPSKNAPESLLAPANADSHVRHVIGVVSGKGGVGKSLVTSLLAVGTQRLGYKAAVLDADITGPSIPQIFGMHGVRITGDDNGMDAPRSASGIPLMSLNLLLQEETTPVIWRGPVIAGTVKQFWTDVRWGDVDYMYVDMPPGTGDVPLTVFQSLPLDGIVIVTSPQELVSMIVEKAVHMAEMMDIPVLGIVENMSYAVCPDCGKHIELYGKSKIDGLASQFDIPVLARMPFDPKLAALCDGGRIEAHDIDYMDDAVKQLTADKSSD